MGAQATPETWRGSGCPRTCSLTSAGCLLTPLVSFLPNGLHRQDPEIQGLLLSDGKHPVHQSHVVVLPADGGGRMAAISFTGALRIPVSTRAWEGFLKGPLSPAVKRTGLWIKL